MLDQPTHDWLKAVIRQPHLPQNAKLLAAILITDDGLEGPPTIADLAKTLNRRISTTLDAMVALEHAGFVQVWLLGQDREPICFPLIHPSDAARPTASAYDQHQGH